MMSKMIKAVLAVIMVVGIVFSIINFASISQLNAISGSLKPGHWEDLPNGKSECMSPGNDCLMLEFIE